MPGSISGAYDPGADYFSTAVRMTGTVVPHVLGRWGFWLFFAIHILVGCLYRSGILIGAEHKKTVLYISWSDMAVVSGITTFSVLFYSNHTFDRYMEIYKVTREMLAHLYEFVYWQALLIGPVSKPHMRVATRFFVCSIFLFFFETSGEISEREWNELLRLELLKPDEKEYLDHFTNQQRRTLLLHWSGKLTRSGFILNKRAPANGLSSMLGLLLKARETQQEVLDLLRLPMPFAYFQLLNIMIVVNLLLWAYGMGISDSMFAPFIYFFSALTFMGIMELASQLADPFGNDAVDFDQNGWMAEVLNNSAVVLEYHYVDADENFKKALSMETAMPFEARPVNIRFEASLLDAEDEEEFKPESDSDLSAQHWRREPLIPPEPFSSVGFSAPPALSPLEASQRSHRHPNISWTEAEDLEEPKYSRWRII
eukprot:gnl/TRDRNA2_/TRDRNA2_34216_c0_seq1.p1 gnl/TRDRNA2_/TRDRNA2_34216_c0~~gnl/TRDRNA2_/TRDRNA2_34216_c0_seq1.p1  ORF type:complete len:426 (+),score=53.68 gnl/TRDRNA2_/TRDRNA2_34216_c0_seq1:115-1392(+)